MYTCSGQYVDWASAREYYNTRTNDGLRIGIFSQKKKFAFIVSVYSFSSIEISFIRILGATIFFKISSQIRKPNKDISSYSFPFLFHYTGLDFLWATWRVFLEKQKSLPCRCIWSELLIWFCFFVCMILVWLWLHVLCCLCLVFVKGD